MKSPNKLMSACLFSLTESEIVKVVSDQEVFDCPDLYSTQEETDTRMILQALHADKRLKELGKHQEYFCLL
jgi:hypothetical protein